MRKILIKFLNFLLEKEYNIEYKHRDLVAIKNWLFKCYADKGAMDYLGQEELKVLKNMARGLNQEQYWIEVGKRQQLSLIVQDFEKEYNLRAAEAAKKKGGEKVESTSNNDNNA